MSEVVQPAGKKLNYLSASKIDTLINCSALYAAKYIWKLPDTGNDGSRRGSVTHDVLELLVKPRHRKHYTDAVLHDTCRETPALWKLVRRFARKYGVDDEANLKQIDGFILVALKSSFFGPKGTFETLAEFPFELKIDRGDGRRFFIRGFIDKIFKVRDKDGLLLVTRDFKSSKQVFEGDKVEFNYQSLIYQLAERELFPEFTRRIFDFLFLRFSSDPIQEQPSFTDDQLDGFEVILTDIQNIVDSFTLDNSMDHCAADSPEKRWLCGRPGNKKDGTPNWICSSRLPMDYWAELDKDGTIVTSAFTEAELKPKPGNTVEKRRYPGCPRWFDPKTGKPRNFQ